jgi:hypothetical protein
MTPDELLSNYLDALFTAPTNLLYSGTAQNALEVGSGIAIEVRFV